MPFQAYLPAGFEHSHESRMFAQLVKALAAHFGPSPEPVCLIGNVMFEDKEIDAVLLKSDVLLVIEMKDYGGTIRFSENTEWYADEVEVKGGTYRNPYSQIRANKIAFLNFLKRNATRILPPPETSQYWHICRVSSLAAIFGSTKSFPKASAILSLFVISAPCRTPLPFSGRADDSFLAQTLAGSLNAST